MNKNMDDLKRKQLDMLKDFDDICKKNNLKYFVFGGTLLGTIRHKGFIPWDDDIDVVMFRDDYDKFLRLGSDKLKPNYFIQCNYTDKINRGHAELRDSNTTCLMKCDYGSKYNCGCFIDVFPMDFVEPSEFFSHIESLKQEYKKIRNYPCKKYGDNHPILALIYNALCLPILRFIYGLGKNRNIEAFRKFERNCSKHNNRTKYCGLLEFWASMDAIKCDYYYDVSDFSDVVYLEFEDFLVPCPIGYHNILSKTYGDYMVPVKGTQLHSSMYFDLDKSYLEYRKVIKSKKRFIKLFD